MEEDPVEDASQLLEKVAVAERIAKQYKQSSSNLAKENAAQKTEVTRLKCVRERVTMMLLCSSKKIMTTCSFFILYLLPCEYF